LQVEALRHALRGGGDGFAFLQRAGEVEAAEHGLELERVFSNSVAMKVRSDGLIERIPAGR
jgi:hypothetical protein